MTRDITLTEKSSINSNVGKKIKTSRLVRPLGDASGAAMKHKRKAYNKGEKNRNGYSITA